jgi:hypothetical protein
MDARLAATPGNSAAVVWLDRSHALIARARRGLPAVTAIDCEQGLESEYLLRIAREAQGCDRVVIMGPDASRIAFEREYVALYRRPERLIDVGLAAAPEPRDLVRQLRLMEPAAKR